MSVSAKHIATFIMGALAGVALTKYHNMSDEEKEISLDLLHHIEDLSDQINKTMEGTTKPALRRYPLTFAVLVVFVGLDM